MVVFISAVVLLKLKRKEKQENGSNEATARNMNMMIGSMRRMEKRIDGMSTEFTNMSTQIDNLKTNMSTQIGNLSNVMIESNPLAFLKFKKSP